MEVCMLRVLCKRYIDSREFALFTHCITEEASQPFHRTKMDISPGLDCLTVTIATTYFDTVCCSDI